MNEENKYLYNQRSEEIETIVERMPTRFGMYITIIVLGLICLMFLFGWLVRYPDIVTGQITLNTSAAPLKLVSNINGKIKFILKKTNSPVHAGQVIAYIENAATPENVYAIDSILKKYPPRSDNIDAIISSLPKSFSLGELNLKYYAFLNSLQNLSNYRNDKLLESQESNYRELLYQQKKAVKGAREKETMANNSLSYARKFYLRDSVLFSKKVISEAEFDRSKLSYLAGKDQLQNSTNSLILSEQQYKQTEGRITELGIQRPEKGKELQISVISTYNELLENIKIWEQRFVFKAPMAGNVQFLRFYSENTFVQAGEQVFTIVPKKGIIHGQVSVPSRGSGKIKRGQEVVIKLDDYPYLEYGSLKGTVSSISITTSTAKVQNNEMEIYLVTVDLPEDPKASFGDRLNIRPEAKGTAEIITKDRKLIERFFDNLRYILRR